MAENYSFFNSKDHDRVYNARHWADYFAPLFKSGVFNGGLRVEAYEGMRIKITAGYAWIDGYGYHLDAPLVLDLETASGNMNRADSIVIRLDLTNRWIKAFVLTGTYYAGAPVPPAPEISATIHEIAPAHINIPAGTTEITQDMIEDTRAEDTICGWVCGAVEQISFEQITAQFNQFFANYKADILSDYEDYTREIGSLETQAGARYDSMDREFTQYENQQKAEIAQWRQDEEAYLNAWLETVQAGYFAWLDGLRDVLDENVAGHLQNEIEAAAVDVFNRYYGLVAQQVDFLPDGRIITTNAEAEIETAFGHDGNGNETATTTISPTEGMYIYVKTSVFMPDRVNTTIRKEERL